MHRESCLHRWLNLADIQDGVGHGATVSESAELRELKKRIVRRFLVGAPGGARR